MTIAAHAIGATKGIVYLRGGVHLPAAAPGGRASRGGAQPGLLGQGRRRGRRVRSSTSRSAWARGAYVCGEETALIESLEGHRGEPRNRPPFPVDTGSLGNPTIVNNVETFAWVAVHPGQGSRVVPRRRAPTSSTGLKLFSVSGDCDRPGVYEFPMGITVAELLQRGRRRQAPRPCRSAAPPAQCVPRREFDRAIAFEDVPTGGSIIVFGPRPRHAGRGRELPRVLRARSRCGQCTPCRDGNPKLLEGVRLLKRAPARRSTCASRARWARPFSWPAKCGLGTVERQRVPVDRRALQGRDLGPHHRDRVTAAKEY